MKAGIKPRGFVFGAAMLCALGFGTTQAFARAYPVEEGDYCNSRTDAISCVQSCVAKYGEGTQGTCARQPGIPYPVCVCIL